MRLCALVVLAVLSGCLSLPLPPTLSMNELLRPPEGARPSVSLGAAPEQQRQGVPSFPGPAAKTRWSGLQFLGEGPGGELRFLSVAGWDEQETQHVERVTLELDPYRGAVAVESGLKLEAPESAAIPFRLLHGVRLPSGTSWFADGVAPGLFTYDSQGRAVERWIPRGLALGGLPVFPTSYGAAGFAVVLGTKDRLRLFAAAPAPGADWCRVLDWDPHTRQVHGEYVYPLEHADARVRAAVWVRENTVLVAESTPGGDQLFTVEFRHARDTARTPGMESTLQTPSVSELRRRGVTPVKKQVLFSLAGTGAVEGLALVDFRTVAVLRVNEEGGEIWLQRRGANLTAGEDVSHTPAVRRTSRPWKSPTQVTL